MGWSNRSWKSAYYCTVSFYCWFCSLKFSKEQPTAIRSGAASCSTIALMMIIPFPCDDGDTVEALLVKLILRIEKSKQPVDANGWKLVVSEIFFIPASKRSDVFLLCCFTTHQKVWVLWCLNKAHTFWTAVELSFRNMMQAVWRIILSCLKSYNLFPIYYDTWHNKRHSLFWLHMAPFSASQHPRSNLFNLRDFKTANQYKAGKKKGI